MDVATLRTRLEKIIADWNSLETVSVSMDRHREVEVVSHTLQR
jgi:hypothetical protein